MKVYLQKLFVMAVMVIVGTMSSWADSIVPVIQGDPTHTLKGIILDSNGEKLTGATYRVTRSDVFSNMGVAFGNTFELSGLVDGDYVIEVTKSGYKNAERNIYLRIETGEHADGTVAKYGQRVEAVFYLEKKRVGLPLSFGTTGMSDWITLETTKQDDGSGNIVYTTDENVADPSVSAKEGKIEVTAIVDAIDPTWHDSGIYSDDVFVSDYDVLHEALLEQGTNINDFSFFMRNISSLEDAADVAADNGIADSRMLHRANNTALPGGYEILTGMAINAGTIDIDFNRLNLPERVTVEFSLPDNDCKKAVRMYRTFKGDFWAELSLTGNTLPNDIKIDMTQDKKIIVVLSRLRTQSFALGVQIIESNQGYSTEVINATPIVNNVTTSIAVTSVKYNAKAGSVLKNEYNGALTDFLRKIVQKKYGLRAVSDPTVEKRYMFNPDYQLPAGGTLYLTGRQNSGSYRFTVRNSNAAFSVTDYRDEYLLPYVVEPDTDIDNTKTDSVVAVLQGDPTHTLKGIILDSNGEMLNGATYHVTRSGAIVSTGIANGNSFELIGLVDGNYEVKVSRIGYKSADRSVTFRIETGKLADGTVAKYAQNVEVVFYLEAMKMSRGLGFDLFSDYDRITLETTKQDDGSGYIVNTTDESVADPTDPDEEGLIEVDVSVDAVSTTEFNTGATNTDDSPKSDYDVLADALAEDGANIDDFSFFLTGVSSLEDAAEVAADNGIAASRIHHRAYTGLPGGYEILTGMAVNAGTVDADFDAMSLPQRLTIEFSLPDNDCKNAVRLYRTFKGDSWAELSLIGGALPYDVKIDMTQDKKIVVTLSRLRTQSFALGVQIIESNQGSSTEVINATPIVNNATTSMAVTSIKYNAKAGSVLKNDYNGALTDFLRKIVMKKYGLRAVENPNVEKEYVFATPYQLPAGGTLYLTGWQNSGSYRFSVRNSNAVFSVTEYQGEYLYPYVVEHASGINETKADGHASGTVYNLNGQKVMKAQKGLYIVDGKKVVMK